jgi:hypothetical protein
MKTTILSILFIAGISLADVQRQNKAKHRAILRQQIPWGRPADIDSLRKGSLFTPISKTKAQDGGYTFRRTTSAPFHTSQI